jgi:hypothetical protein
MYVSTCLLEFSQVIELLLRLQLSELKLCHVERNVMSVVIGANCTISKSSRKYLGNIPRKHDIKELQKIAVLALLTYFEKY